MKVYIREVKEDREGFSLVADESPFYPDGKGGQLGDRGRIGDVEVVRVLEKDDGIHHIVKKELEPGEYEVWIDEERRKEIARQHTAQHILSAAFVKVADIDTVSFHMGEDFSTIDLNVSPIIKDVFDEVEELANRIVMENRRVEVHLVGREDLNKFRLRKRLPENIKGKIRIVEVEDFDISACGGFHVKRTGEVGCIKIIDHEKVKGNLTRVYFVAGFRALKVFRERVDLLKVLTKMLTTSPKELKSRINNILDEIKKKSAMLDKISEELARMLADVLLNKAEKVSGFSIVSYDGYESVGKYLFKFLGDKEGVLIIVKSGNGYEIGSSSLHVGKLIKILNERFGSKGGGGERRGRIQTDKPLNVLIEEIKEILKGGSL